MLYMSNNNCYAKVIGGLGNQLFIVAAAYAYSERYNKVLQIDSNGWFAGQGKNANDYRDSIFSNFNYGEENLEHVTALNEKRFNYDELPYSKLSVSLNGYFQSLKYFADKKDYFLNQLNLPNVDTSCIKGKNVAFHIRRGDYMRHPDIHNICKTDYFKTQFQEFKDYQINVFTDSPEVVLQEFEGEDFNLIQTSSELNDLTLMSKHDNIVCSNSTFSWWAALIGKMNRIIVPDKWIYNTDCEDIYTSNMTRIEV